MLPSEVLRKNLPYVVAENIRIDTKLGEYHYSPNKNHAIRRVATRRYQNMEPLVHIRSIILLVFV